MVHAMRDEGRVEWGRRSSAAARMEFSTWRIPISGDRSASRISPHCCFRDCSSRFQPWARGDVVSKRVANLIVETLQAAGVKNCYGIVGDTLNQIAHAI